MPRTYAGLENATYVSILCLLLGAQSGLAQTGPEPDAAYNNALEISPVDFGRSYFAVAYERYFGDRNYSFLVSPTFMLKDSPFESFTGFQLTVNPRFHLTQLKKGEHNTIGFHSVDFYTGPYLSGTTYDEDFRSGYIDERSREFVEGEYNKDVRAVETGIILGVQLNITPRFLLDIYAGGGIRYAANSNNLPEQLRDQYVGFSGGGVFDIEYTGVKPQLGLLIGFTF